MGPAHALCVRIPSGFENLLHFRRVGLSWGRRPGLDSMVCSSRIPRTASRQEHPPLVHHSPFRVFSTDMPQHFPRFLALAFAALTACGAHNEQARPDVILVVIDTLRADALSCYGNPRKTTPNLDKLAEEGLLFEEVYSHAPNTGPAHASLFTGFHPWAHAVANIDHPQRGPAQLDDDFVTLAERFSAAGYQTAAFTDGAILGEDWNLLQGFEHVQADPAGVAVKVDQALALLANERDDRPLFLLLHTYQVHMPYTAPAPFGRLYDPDYEGVLLETDLQIRQTWEERGHLPPFKLLKDEAQFTARDYQHLVALYHGELAYTDRELGRLWAGLKQSGTFAKSLIAVTADHGEEFGEHGQIGHRQLHKETLHVPLIVRLPEQSAGVALGSRIQGRFGSIDLHDLLLNVSGVWPDPGRNHLMHAAGGAPLQPRPHHAERTDRLHLGPDAPLDRSIRLGDRVLLERFENGHVTRRTFELKSDPTESKPLDLVYEDLEEKLDAHFADQEKLRTELIGESWNQAASPTDAATRRQLRALGYVDGSADR